MKCSQAIGIVTFCLFPFFAHCAATEVPSREVRWLEGNGVPSQGTTWGVPWPRGAVLPGTSFALAGANGNAVPMQVWPLAYWPDGSLKWTAHAIPATENLAGPLLLKPGAETLPGKPLTVTEDATVITIDTGAIQCRIHKSGDVVIDSITRDGKILATSGALVCSLRDSPDLEDGGTFRQESFQGRISSVIVEQKGPVRAVIKIRASM